MASLIQSSALIILPGRWCWKEITGSSQRKQVHLISGPCRTSFRTCDLRAGHFLSQIRRLTKLLPPQIRRLTRDEVVASEVAPDSPESRQAAVSPDVIEHASSESCSPPGTFDSPRHRKQNHLWRHSIPDYQVRPVPSPASSSRPAVMEADTSLPPTKWGRCHVCGYICFRKICWIGASAMLWFLAVRRQ